MRLLKCLVAVQPSSFARLSFGLNSLQVLALMNRFRSCEPKQYGAYSHRRVLTGSAFPQPPAIPVRAINLFRALLLVVCTQSRHSFTRHAVYTRKIVSFFVCVHICTIGTCHQLLVCGISDEYKFAIVVRVAIKCKAACVQRMLPSCCHAQLVGIVP